MARGSGSEGRVSQARFNDLDYAFASDAPLDNETAYGLMLGVKYTF